MIDRTIDYIHFSADFPELACIQNQYEPISPTKFYSRGYRMPQGYRVFYGNPKNPMLAFFIASGETLENVRSSGLTDAEILSWVFHVGGKIGRLDLTVTEWIEDSLVLVSDVERWYKENLITSPLVKRGAKIITAINQEIENTPETLYIGDLEKRGRNGIFRAYDRGIAMKLPEYLITRLELELKGDKANNNAKRIADTGDIAGNFRASFNVKSDEFERLMDSPITIVSRGQGKPKMTESDESKKRWDWLINQVAPALEKAYKQDLIEGRGDKNLSAFLVKSGLSSVMRDLVDKRASYEVQQRVLAGQEYYKD